MKEYLITTKINNGETGELIEEIRLIYRDEKARFESADELDKALEADDYEWLDDLIQEIREYECEYTDVYRVNVVELAEELPDEK